MISFLSDTIFPHIFPCMSSVLLRCPIWSFIACCVALIMLVCIEMLLRFLAYSWLSCGFIFLCSLR